jgi:mannosyltransferase OCH1-like enzyme
MWMFSYWDTPDHDPIAQFLEEWRSYFQDFHIFGDAEIEAMIATHFPQYLGLFRRIRIPTCKSDIAILVGLYARGGLYVDCHCGIADAAKLSQLLADSPNWEVVLYNKDFTAEPRPPDAVRPLNSVMVARPFSPIIRASAALAFRNLQQHWEVERQATSHVPYDIWSMTGPGVLEHTICIPPPARWALPRGLRPEHVGKVRFIQEGPGAPVVRYRHYAYRSPGAHWSERQTRERLFHEG